MTTRGKGRPTVYKTADGTRVPGVTTILGRFKESGGLIRWAYKCGCDGIDMDAARDNAASAGTLTHGMIEAHIHGAAYDVPTLRDLFGPGADEKCAEEYEKIVSRARNAFDQYLAWRETTKLELTATEVPLVSEAFRFGGTIDAIGRVGGRVVLPDWKTSARIYSDYLLQVAAYRQLWEEHHPDEKIESVILIRFDKETDASSQHTWGLDTLDQAWEMFRHLRAAYELDSRLRKAAA
jgi:hypothetical protein